MKVGNIFVDAVSGYSTRFYKNNICKNEAQIWPKIKNNVRTMKAGIWNHKCKVYFS